MSSANTDTLCGGTFFALLLESLKNRASVTREVRGQRGGIKQTLVFEELLKILDPSFTAPAGSSYGSWVTKYKQCEFAGSIDLPFGEPEFREKVARETKENIETAWKRSAMFCRCFLTDDRQQIEWLARALLTLVMKDGNITPKQQFFLTRSDEPVMKKDLPHLKVVSLAGLILGLWFYIVTEVPNNEAGRPTFERWFREPAQVSKRSPWKFIKENVDTGVWKGLKIEVPVDLPLSKPETEETVEAELIYGEESASQAFPGARLTNLNVTVNGGQSTVYGNINNYGFGGDSK